MNNEVTTFLADVAMMLPAFLIAISFHEFCHALVATLLGDNTPKRMGRLTLNPLSHIDPIGLFFLMIFKFGWANAVEVDERNFKYPRLYPILVALAGPCSNFFLAVVTLYLIKFFPSNLVNVTVAITCKQILYATASFNIMLGVFNLLPIPPLDGSHILRVLLEKHFPEFIEWIYRYSLFILLGIFMLPPVRMQLHNLMHYTQLIIENFVF